MIARVRHIKYFAQFNTRKIEKASSLARRNAFSLKCTIAPINIIKKKTIIFLKTTTKEKIHDLHKLGNCSVIQ